jgi:hypothetical protein
MKKGKTSITFIVVYLIYSLHLSFLNHYCIIMGCKRKGKIREDIKKIGIFNRLFHL